MESERSINRIGIGIEKNDLSGIEIFIYIYLYINYLKNYIRAKKP
jgi:hypothetical protein